MKPDMEELLKLYPEFWTALGQPGQPWVDKNRAEFSPTSKAAALFRLRSMSLEDAHRHLEANPPSALTILELIDMAMRAGKSARSSEVASRKNNDARAFVQEAWLRAKSKDPKLTKRAFAESIGPDLRRRPYLLSVRPERIAHVWLKGL